MPRRNEKRRSDEKRPSFGERGGDAGPPRKKTCRFCADPQLRIDFKDGRALRPFLSDRDKILPNRITGLCAYHQRRMTEAIKRARVMGLVSFSAGQREAIGPKF